VVDDPVHHAVVGEESDDLHLPTALGAEHGIDFIDFTDHLGPAFGRETPELLLHHPERKRPKACLPDLPPMSIGVQAEVTDSDLSLVGNMGSDPGDELQVVHALYLLGVFPIPIADLGLFLRERESLQGQQRPNHVLSHPLGLGLGLGPDPAVDIEPRVPPGEKAFRPFGTQQLLVDQKPKNLPSEELSQPRVVDPGELMEEAGLVHSALGHQEMEVGVKIHPVPKCLNGRNDSGHQLAAGQGREIPGQAPEVRAAKITQEAPLVLEEGPEHPGDGEDDLAVRDIEEKLLSHPLAPLLQAFGMAGGTETAGAAGKHQEPLLATVRTTDAGEPTAGIATVQITLDDFFDDRPEVAVLLLKTSLVLRQEPVKVMEQHPIEDSPLGMSRTIHSRHNGRMASRTGPSPRI